MVQFLIVIILICFGVFITSLLIKNINSSDNMINLSLSFSVNEAISLFRNAGLEVYMQEIPMYIPNPHGDSGTENLIPVWVVVNPHTGTIEKLEVYFQKYLDMKKQHLFLTAGKLEIYTLFDNKSVAASI